MREVDIQIKKIEGDIMICRSCGNPFDMSDLQDVIKHEHYTDKTETDMEVKSKKVVDRNWVSNEAYPNARPEFCTGVWKYLNGEPYPVYPASKEVMQGYYSAERDLKDNYIAKR